MQTYNKLFLFPSNNLTGVNTPPLQSPRSNRFFKIEAITSDKKTEAIICNLFTQKEFSELWENTQKKLLLSAPIKIVPLSEKACVQKNVKNARFTYQTVGPLLNDLVIEYKDTLTDLNIKHCIVYETINISFAPKYSALDKKLINNLITKKDYFNEIYKTERRVAKKTDKLSVKLFPDHPELLYGENTKSLASFIKFANNQGHTELIHSQANRVAALSPR